MPGGDTITQAVRREPTIGELLADVLFRAVCRRWGHRWQDYGRPLPFGKREWCSRCRTNRITLADGEVVSATAPEVMAAHVPFAEALYEARWGEPPRKPMRVGEWPAI